MAPKAKAKPMAVPDWLPDPDTHDAVVNINILVQRMEAMIKKCLGQGFAKKKPLPIGKVGWSAPFDEAAAMVALKTTGAYQCALNLFTAKLLSPDDITAISWRNVRYLADFYWNVTRAMTSGGEFKTEHFPHTLHLYLRDVGEITRAWDWGVFDRFQGAEIMLAFCLGIVCACERNSDLQPFAKSS